VKRALALLGHRSPAVSKLSAYGMVAGHSTVRVLKLAPHTVVDEL
jgi:hypothetical protein